MYFVFIYSPLTVHFTLLLSSCYFQIALPFNFVSYTPLDCIYKENQRTFVYVGVAHFAYYDTLTFPY